MSIRAIKEGLIKEDMLLDAFIRSANTSERPSVESWCDRWHVIIGTIEQMQLQLPNYDKDKQFIESILSAGKYAISHSPEWHVLNDEKDYVDFNPDCKAPAANG